MTVKEARAKLRELRALDDCNAVVRFGLTEVCHVGSGYAIKSADDKDDPMTDYCAWSFGWKEKWVLDYLVNTGFLTKEAD